MVEAARKVSYEKVRFTPEQIERGELLSLPKLELYDDIEFEEDEDIVLKGLAEGKRYTQFNKRDGTGFDRSEVYNLARKIYLKFNNRMPKNENGQRHVRHLAILWGVYNGNIQTSLTLSLGQGKVMLTPEEELVSKGTIWAYKRVYLANLFGVSTQAIDEFRGSAIRKFKIDSSEELLVGAANTTRIRYERELKRALK